MGLRGYISVLRARWVIVVSCALIAIAVAGILALRTPKVYVAQASVFFAVSVNQTTRELSSGFSYTEGLVSSYAQVATEPVVLNPVISELGLDVTPKQLASSIDAQAPLDTVIIDIGVSNASPERAAEIANAVARQLAVTVGELVPGAGAASQAAPVRVTTVGPAAVPSSYASPRMALNLTLGLLVGGFIGVILAFVRDILDPRIGGRRDVERVTEIPVIGTIREPNDGSLRRQWFGGPRNLAEDRAKELRTNFQHIRVARRLRSVVFTSAQDDRATALTVISLGAELAHAGIRTIVVDGDLRNPTLATWYGVEASGLGLSSVLNGDAGWRDAVQRRERLPLAVLPAGPMLDPSTLLRPAPISALLDELAENFDVILIKAPPVLRVADGLLLSRLADATVVVADGPAMNRNELSEEVHVLGVADALVLGIVLMA